MRIAIAQCYHESNMFTTRRSTLEMFRAHEYVWGEELVARQEGMRSYVGGMLEEARERGIEAVPVISIRMSPAPMLEAAAWGTISRDFLAAFDGIGPVDGICVAMHGAMATENQLDPEGFLLSALRERFGPQMPIAASLDIHANISAAMLAAADGLFGSKGYPEVDNWERGREALAFVAEVAGGRVRPVKAHRYLPMLAQKQETAAEPARSIMTLCRSLEAGAVLNCTLYFGFPGADVEFLGTHVVALANGDQAAAESAADRVASTMWERRAEFYQAFPTAEEAVAQALAHQGAPVVIADSSDNPGGGYYGDATHLLRAMLAHSAELRPAAFAFITDPETVNQAWQAGVGASFRARIGGKSADARSEPVEATVRVKALTPGDYVLSGPMRTGTTVEMGRTALLEVDGLDLVVASYEQPTQVFDEEPFRLHGIEPSRCKAVGLKSTTHFLAAYRPIASLVVIARRDGSYGANRNYSRLRTPLWSPPVPEPQP